MSPSFEIENRQVELDAFLLKYFGAADPVAPPVDNSHVHREAIDDQALIAKIEQSKQADKFRRLFNGNIDGHSSNSEADLSLCNKFAFWTGKNFEQMDRLFRLSGLMRPRWDEKHGALTYGEITMRKAIADCAEGYSGQQEAPGASMEARASLPDFLPMDILSCLGTLPPKREFIVEGYIPAGACGLGIGTGNVGKSFLMLLVSMAVACGRSIGPFIVPEPRRVLILNVEDDHDDIHRRMYRIAEAYGFSQAELELMGENLIIFPGRGIIKPLMEIRDMNPMEAPAFEWLRQQVERYDPGLVLLDTKARLYGVNENDNDHGSQWLGLLESLLVEHKRCSILIVAHTSKANAGNGEQHSNRGASSIGDNCRFGMAVTFLLDEDGATYGIRDAADHIKLTHTKGSYSKKLDPVIFKKNEHGVPIMIDTINARNDSLGDALDVLITVLKAYPQGVNKRKLERGEGETCKAIKSEVMEFCQLPKKDWPQIVDLGIESARLETFEDHGDGKTKPVFVRARQAVILDSSCHKTPSRQAVISCQGSVLDSLK